MWLPSNSRTDDAPRVPAVATPVQTYSVSDPVRTTKAPLAEPWSCQPVLEPAGQVISQMSAPAPAPTRAQVRSGTDRSTCASGSWVARCSASAVRAASCRSVVRLDARPVERTAGAWEVGKVAVMGPPENNVELLTLHCPVDDWGHVQHP